MQRRSNILTDHMKYMYMLLMGLTQSHSYVFPFIKKLEEAVFIPRAEVHV